MNHKTGYYVVQHKSKGPIYLFAGSDSDVMYASMVGWDFERVGRDGYKQRKRDGALKVITWQSMMSVN